MSLTQLMIRPDILAAHRATWFVVSGRQRLRRTKSMRGTWGHDVTCSCGWDSTTGGATKRTVEDLLFDHRMDAQIDADALAQACPKCESAPGTGCTDWGRPVSYMHAERYQAIPD